jgi:hypothetical protein
MFAVADETAEVAALTTERAHFIAGLFGLVA